MKVRGGQMVPVQMSNEDRRDLATIQKALADAKKAMNLASATLNKALQRNGGRGPGLVTTAVYDRMNSAQQAVYWLENEVALINVP